MKICRFRHGSDDIRLGLVIDEPVVHDLTPAGITHLHPLLESDDPAGPLRQIAVRDLPRVRLNEIRLCAPVERQEVWAAGVTYLRSKAARMEESVHEATVYDRVYDAERPELFFKALPEKVADPGQPVGIRRDARWNVPEPELALVLNSRGRIVGYTIGNDMSSRDIEGENPLYLPQAKVYDRSCALGPWIALGIPEATARTWMIRLTISRGGGTVFSGETSVSQIKRGFDELPSFLFRSQTFAHGAVLLTGTGIVPPSDVTLREQDDIAIEISGIGVLRNRVLVL
jgi:2-dehydro-3-deoxy-D-arabinonate dehydratase